MPLIPPSLQPATRCVANRAGRLVGLLVLLPARSALPTKFRVPALPTPSTGTICTQCFGSLSLLPPYATHFTVLPPFPPTFLSAPSPTPWSLSPSSPLFSSPSPDSFSTSYPVSFLCGSHYRVSGTRRCWPKHRFNGLRLGAWFVLRTEAARKAKLPLDR